MDEPMTRWWGAFEVGLEETACWKVGPMSLWIERRRSEWRVLHQTGRDNRVEKVVVENPTSVPFPQEEGLQRFAFRQTERHLFLHPSLADRAIISRPETPLFIPPGEELSLYISSPLWFRLEASGKPLREYPVIRLSDTWFGSPVEEGGLCYASSTLALTHIEEFPFSSYRAVTVLLVRNRADKPLGIERINLPMLFLSLYLSDSGYFWTQPVTLEWDKDGGELALFKFGKELPAEAGKGVLLTEARRKAEKNLMIQAFSKLFS